MVLKLYNYNLDVISKCHKEHVIADVLSCPHLLLTEPLLNGDLLEVMTVQVLSSHHTHELLWRGMSHVKSSLMLFCMVGQTPKGNCPMQYALHPFFSMCKELTVQDGLLLHGQGLIIPSVLQKFFVIQLHQGHRSITIIQVCCKIC